MEDESRRRTENLEAEVRRLNARLDGLKSSWSHRLGAPLRLVERRLAAGRRRPAPPPAAMPDDQSYAAWVARFDTIDAVDVVLVRADIERAGPLPTISVALLTAAGVPTADALEALHGQVHAGFEILVAGGTRVARGVRRALRRRGIVLRFVPEGRRGDEAAVAAALLAAARGDYFLAVVPGDRLAPLATYHIARAAVADAERPILLYGDEDEIGPDGARTRPFFKPDWDPELVLAFDYPGAATAFRTERLRAVGGIDRGAGPAWRWDAALRVAERQVGPDAAAPPGIVHLPFILVHRRPAAPDPALAEAGRQVVAAALARRDEAADVSIGVDGMLSVRRAVPAPAPHVSIVVATRDRAALLKRCIASVLDRTDYPSLDLTIIDNGSVEPETLGYLDALRSDPRVTIVRDDGPFNFAVLHNRAIAHVRGDVVVLLNNDTEVIGPDWLERLVAQAVRPGVGAVGAKLYFPDDTIQHAGVFLGVRGAAIHLHAHRRRDDPGPHGLLTVARNLTAVTGACLALRRAVYAEIGGLNEAFMVDFNDIDLCLRLRRRGYQVIWEPKAELYHVEAATRGRRHVAPDADGEASRSRFQAEVALFRGLWAGALRADRSYNPNLSASTLDYAPAFPPRVVRPWLGPVPGEGVAGAGAPDGIAIIGHLRAEVGLGQAARSCAQAFAAAGHPTSTHPFVMPENFEERVPFPDSGPTSPYGTVLLYLNADTLLAHRTRLPLDAGAGRRRIGFWHWELPVFPAAWAPAFDLVDEIWTSSRYSAEAIAAATVKPVRVLPHPVGGADILERDDARARLGLPRDVPILLSAFDTNSMPARKNPDAVLRAFTDAFGHGAQGPVLVLKFHGRSQRSAAFAAFLRRAAGTARVVLIDRVMTPDEVAMLHAASDVHVSLHRAEGYGLNLAEAMAAGRLAIGTGFSGNLEFMTEANSILIPYAMRRVEPGEYVHGTGQWWAEPDHDAAVAAMRRAVLDPASVAPLAERAARDMAAAFSFESVGRRLMRALSGELPVAPGA